MPIEIKEIKPTRSGIKQFTLFSTNLYKDSPYYVPDLLMDNYTTLSPAKNPAADFCDSVLYMAYRDGRAVGRVAGIINRVVNERTGARRVRFGFIDFIDDPEVSAALLRAVESWGKSHGMDTIVGPLGFTDMDPEGMLVEGFDQVSTMATIYNHPYYPRHLERLGYQGEKDWVEFRVTVPEAIPDKMLRIARIVEQKFKLHSIHPANKKELINNYGQQIFTLINDAYNQLYGYSPLSPRQIEHYISMYIPIVRLEEISLVGDEQGRLVGVGIAIPSLSQALIRSRGKLLPLGWAHLLRGLRGKNDTVDLMLIAVKPELQSMGVNSLFFIDLIPQFIKHGYTAAESNPELAENQKVMSQWKYFDYVQHKRRRAFSKQL